MKKLYVIKIGGNIIDDEEKLSAFLNAFSKIEENKILIHGGGKLATRLAQQLGVEQQLVEGRRITDAETLRIVTMVYAGFINKNIVAGLQALSCNAIGLSGADGGLIRTHKRIHPTIDFGFVGDVDFVNSSLIKNLIENKSALVVAPITCSEDGVLLNTNADTIAQEIAKAMSREYEVQLIYSFEKKGVLKNTEDENSVISSINPQEYAELKQQQVIHSGMLPKLDNAFAAIQHGVKKVIIGKAENLASLISGEAGTKIVHE